MAYLAPAEPVLGCEVSSRLRQPFAFDRLGGGCA
jgi:hypothetical protein